MSASSDLVQSFTNTENESQSITSNSSSNSDLQEAFKNTNSKFKEKNIK